MAGSFPLDVSTLLPVFNYLNVGVYITDRDRRIVLWNRKAEEITGWRASAVVGKACHEELLNHVDKAGHQLCHTDLCPLKRAMMLNQESRDPVLVYAQHANGRRVAVSVSVAPLRDAAGKVIGGIETFRDETEQVRDLEFAQKMQRRLMPEKLPRAGLIELDARYYPHDLLGGDFYDVRDLGEGRFGILVADVRGHGVSASLYTMSLKSLEESVSEPATAPARFLTALNRELTRFVVEESFATAFYGVLDTTSCAIRYANAGHPAPIHFARNAGKSRELTGAGMPLGISAAEAYDEQSATLEPGDLLLWYTDGITESRDAQGRMLGQEGLVALARSELRVSPRNALERIYCKALERCGSVSFEDDVLLLSARRAP